MENKENEIIEEQTARLIADSSSEDYKKESEKIKEK